MVLIEGEILLARVKQGDHNAMKELFMSYYDLAFVTVRRIINDIGVTEDITQDIFIDIWTKRDSISITSSLGSYIKRMAINKSLNHIRKAKKLLFTDGFDNDMPVSYNVDSIMDAASLEEHIHKSVDLLPEQCKLIFILSRFEEMSNREIAEHLNLSIKTIENQMTKALRSLKQAIDIYKR